ncbi:hypothetical protein PHYPSEUDO_002012 [Phytophthora pseudosyringae]|uniref:Uncharacterized protein n=1 Tax=Phytophthora pseudosyringae TaxID=221518 RepID=A0A8T1VYP1_9STRA|nr:hypothetical protein PHYPSEUDO_002012 [Phytophthora pseudosyringae]
MTRSRAQELVQFVTDMFLANAERTDALVTRANSVLGWSDKRAVVEDMWAQFLLTKEFPRQSARELVERTWSATVNVDKLRGMLKWPAGMTVRHRLSANAYVAETSNGFLISTQNINLTGGADAAAGQMLDQRLLRLADIPLETMYGFQFERQFCERTGEELGCRVKLAGRTSDCSLSYAHKLLTEALPSIL